MVIATHNADINNLVDASILSAPTNMIGHQGLDWGVENGVPKLFATLGQQYYPTNGQFIVSFSPPTVNGGSITNIVKYKVWDDSENTTTTAPTNVSFSKDKALFAVFSITRGSTGQAVIKIFKSSVLNGVDNTNISSQFIHKFYVPSVYNVSTVGVCQDIALDSGLVYLSYYLVAGSFIDVLDFNGNLVSRQPHKVGKSYSDSLTNSGYNSEYEPEALVWVNDSLCMHVVCGYNSTTTKRANAIMLIDSTSVVSRTKDKKVINATGIQVAAVSGAGESKILEVSATDVSMLTDNTGGLYFLKNTGDLRQVYNISANSVSGNGKSPYIGFYRDDDTDTALQGSLVLMCGKHGGTQGLHINANNLSVEPAVTKTMSLGRSGREFTKLFAQSANLSSLGVYASNSGARSAGLQTGDVYRTATGQLMVVY